MEIGGISPYLVVIKVEEITYARRSSFNAQYDFNSKFPHLVFRPS